MTENDLSTAFEKRVDSPQQLQDVLTIVANALGPHGGTLSAGLANCATQKRFDNIQNMLDALRGRLEQLPSGTFEDVLSSDAFIHLCVNAMENAQKEHRESKRELFGTYLANTAGNSNFEYEISNHFLELLDAVDEFDLTILKFLDDHGVREKSDKDWIEFKQIASLANGTRSNEIVRSNLQRLASFSVIKTTGSGKMLVGTNPVGLWYVSSYSITETGQQFIRFLDSE